MNRSISRSFALMLLVIFSLIYTTSPALAQPKPQYADPSAAEMITDLVVIRPTNLAATVVGTAFFVVTLPFTIAGRNAGHAARMFVVNPAKFTFARPLGDHDAMAFWPFKYDWPDKQ